MVKGLTNARVVFNNGSTLSGGDKIWVKKELGAPVNKGDKVFIRKNLYGDLVFIGTYLNPSTRISYCCDNGTVYAYGTGGSFIRYDIIEGTYTQGTIIGKGSTSFYFQRTKRYGDYIVFVEYSDVKKVAPMDVIVGETSIFEVQGKVLREDLILKYVSGGIYRLIRFDIETNTYGEELGVIDFNNTSKNVVDIKLDGNILLLTTDVSSKYAFNFYDISDLYNPILIKSTDVSSKPKIYCATGLNVGDYIITGTTGDVVTLYDSMIYQIKENYSVGSANDINPEIPRLLSNKPTICYNEENNILSVAHNFFKFENGGFNRVKIEYKSVSFHNTKYGVLYVVSNNLETSTRQFQNTASTPKLILDFYRRNELDANWTTSDVYSSEVYTGLFTGETDEQGRVEVEILLPSKINITVTTNVDVAENEIIFEGVVE